jgi:hypothetical protein
MHIMLGRYLYSCKKVIMTWNMKSDKIRLIIIGSHFDVMKVIIYILPMKKIDHCEVDLCMVDVMMCKEVSLYKKRTSSVLEHWREIVVINHNLLCVRFDEEANRLCCRCLMTYIISSSWQIEHARWLLNWVSPTGSSAGVQRTWSFCSHLGMLEVWE